MRPRSKLPGGTSRPGRGAASRNGAPALPINVSVKGLNDSRPATANAVTISGLAMKFIVVGWPSLRRGKFRLYDVTIVLGASAASLVLRHCPMHGPQAFASTVALMAW